MPSTRLLCTYSKSAYVPVNLERRKGVVYWGERYYVSVSTVTTHYWWQATVLEFLVLAQALLACVSAVWSSAATSQRSALHDKHLVTLDLFNVVTVALARSDMSSRRW